MRSTLVRSLACAAILSAASCGGESRTGEEVHRSATAFTAESPFGLNAHAARDEFLFTFLDAGIAWYRVDCEWSVNEPHDGELDFSLTDRLVDTIKSRGGFVKIDPAYTPPWASYAGGTASPPKDPARFVKYVREVAKRYRGVADCIGVWNEPNLGQFWGGTKTQFINDILVPSLQAIKEEAPEMTTCGPDLSSAGNVRDDWMGPILAAAGPLLDVITHHQYDGKDTVSGRVSEIEKMHQFLAQRGYGDKPLWITETGWDAPHFSRATQAQNLMSLMQAMQARSSWWKRTFWYDSHGAGWGLLDGEGGAPTPSLDAYRSVIANSAYAPGAGSPPPPPTDPGPPPSPPSAPAGPNVLGGGQSLAPGAQIASTDGRFVLVYQGDGNLVLYQSGSPLWSSATSGRTTNVAAMQGDGNLVVYDASSAPVWNSGTAGHPGSSLVLQNDGNLVIYAPSGGALWSSGTCCR